MHRIWLLIWKNLILRKRHWLVTGLEMLLPVGFVLLLAFVKLQLQGPGMVSNLTTESTPTIFPEKEEGILKDSANSALFCSSCFVGYAPENAHTTQVIEQLASCLNSSNPSAIGRKPFANEEAIENYVASTRSDVALHSNLRVAVVFEDGLGVGTGSSSGSVSYKIRQLRHVPDNFHNLFPSIQSPGPDKKNAELYVIMGFIGLQVCLDKAIVEKLSGRPFAHEISLQPFPYPPYVSTKNFNEIYFDFLPGLIVFGFIFIVPSILKGVVSEKQTGIRELMKLNGVAGWMQWLGWMLNSLLIFIISVSIVVILMFSNLGGGAIFVYSDSSIWWLVLMLYAMSATSFCFFISSFFTKPSLAITVGLIFWYVTFDYSHAYLHENYDTSSKTLKMAFALIPNVALDLAIRIISSMEAKAAGIQWSNIGVSISSTTSLSLVDIIFMFLVNTFIYMFLTIYLENVLPSEFGVRKPFYYIFQSKTYCKRKVTWDNNRKKIDASGDRGQFGVADMNGNSAGFEDGPNDATVGVDIKNLSKDFGGHKVAVDGVSVKMYDGEIFALLGHNGAGKTTTISMLTGMFAPSGGTAIVNGYDITTNLDGARKNLGLCPQKNMLFDKLTVLEHLVIFGEFKGLSVQAALVKAKQLVKKLQLTGNEHTLSKDLSGGLKRKLSLGMALVGETKVVILDEPTSGMDPEARRVIWDVLLEMRGQRTIILTTHFMEEADVLGDRIGIMSSGKLQCCGSSMFLKVFYGTGYTLKMSVTEDAKQEMILPTLQYFIPDASIKATRSTPAPASEMRFTLPIETATTSVLSDMFTELQRLKNELGIKTVGLSITTMDEVFVRVGQLTDEHHHLAVEGKKRDEDDDEEDAPNKFVDGRMAKEDRLTGLNLAVGQFIALFIKKYIYTWRNWKLIIPQLIIPVILILFAILATSSLLGEPKPVPPLPLSLDRYHDGLVTLASSTYSGISSQFPVVIGPSFQKVPTGKTLSQALLNKGNSKIAEYRQNYIVGINATASSVTAMFNTIPNHAAPLAINLVSNLILKSLEPTKDLKISVTSHPLESTVNAYLDAANPDPDFSYHIPVLFGVCLPFGLAMLAGSFIVFPIEENMCKAKQLQMMTGIGPLIYWYSAFLWDFILVFLVVCVMTLCFPIFETYGFFTSNFGAGTVFLILVVYGFSVIWLSYIFSLITTTVGGGFALVSVIHVASGLILSLSVFGFEYAGKDWKVATEILRMIGRLFPTFSASLATMRFTELASKNGRCNFLSGEAKDFICDPSVSIDPAFRQCCGNCQVLPGVTCFSPLPYITWEYDKGVANTVPGIGQELVMMIIMAFLYQTILLIAEYQVVQQLLKLRTKEAVKLEDNVTDDDVKAEAKRVTDMIKRGKVHEDALVVENLAKKYGTFEAVSKLNFGVHHGECFGLLGVNGAGKTTTFRMLTGDETRSHGNAYAFTKTLEKNRREFLSNIGYCPQYDGVIEVLSGREMLKLFGRLRGVPGNIVGVEADKWLERMGLHENANVQCGKYSGGMKRRLSVAMAMIGDPPLLFLDEPTSGVDPVSRRQFWDVLGSVRDTGQAIILTSHSMEECEVLCSRLAIMVNGQLQCIGGVQHLKSKFAQGYSLSVKLTQNISQNSQPVSYLISDISSHFQPCFLKDIHQTMFQFQLLNTALAWDVLFKAMEEIKSTFQSIVEDYSLNETSLEEVFLAFARAQCGSRSDEESKLKP